METVIMKCGCAAQGKVSRVVDGVRQPEIPGCVIHDCYEPAAVEPDLTGRVARCTYGCGSESPSSKNLAFFEYLGEGSREAQTKCKNCGYAEVAHTAEKRAKNHRICSTFAPTGARATDRYYCGCHGWD